MKHKFNAVRCECDGIKFASKAERAYYNKLKLLQESGEVLFFLCQVPFILDAGIKYICDFQVFYAPKGEEPGEISFVDVKGVCTSNFLLKKRLLEKKYPIKLEIVK